jgi:hypothetical protein
MTTTGGWKSWIMKTLEQLFEYGSFQPSHDNDWQKMCSSEKHIYDTYPKITRYSNPEIPNKLGI